MAGGQSLRAGCFLFSINTEQTGGVWSWPGITGESRKQSWFPVLQLVPSGPSECQGSGLTFKSGVRIQASPLNPSGGSGWPGLES